MAYLNYEVEFPCGLKYKVKTKGFFMTASFDEDTISCPLHGKKCSQITTGAKK